MRLAVAALLLAALSTQSSGQVFRDCAECPEMVVVPAGKFTMGISEEAEAKLGVPEANRRRAVPLIEVVFAKPFAVGRFEVTRGQYAAFVAATGYVQKDFSGCWDAYGIPAKAGDDARRNTGRNKYHAEFDWRNPGFTQTDDHPVLCINLPDMRAYLAWLSERAGRPYRLLSESEAEYTTRAGSTTAWPWGDDPNVACEHANVSDLTRADVEDLKRSPDYIFQCRDGYAQTSPVGSFKPNAFGLYDTIGNVWEVQEGCFSYGLEKMPRDGSPSQSGECGILNPLHGGAWDIFPYSTHSAYRSRYETLALHQARYVYVGFRVATSVVP